jgi:hypothetical protein
VDERRGREQRKRKSWAPLPDPVAKNGKDDDDRVDETSKENKKMVKKMGSLFRLVSRFTSFLSLPSHLPLSSSSYRSPRLCCASGMFLLLVATSSRSSSAVETPTLEAPASTNTCPQGETASECPWAI